jgi:hypothetical protein
MLYFYAGRKETHARNQFVFRHKETMNWADHNPPHFHVEYAGHRALVGIDEAVVIKGSLPNQQLKLVLAWCEIHRDELMQNWVLAEANKPLNEIAPLA